MSSFKLIIGSVAECKFTSEPILRKKGRSDIDVLWEKPSKTIRLPDSSKYSVIEYHDARKNPALYKIFLRYKKENVRYMRFTDLYDLKISHSLWNIHWPKTFQWIAKVQNKYAMRMTSGKNYISEDAEELYQGWLPIHGDKSHIKLNLDDKADFFTKAVTRKYVHDDIHKAIAYHDKEPMYTNITTNIFPSRMLFNNLSGIDKKILALEEIYVIMLERFLIPKNFNMSIKSAYYSAIQLVVTQLTKNWFPKYIMNNADFFFKLDLDRYDPIKKFKVALENGEIRESN